ncbi:Mrp/NBP35 family ATP-binding protein [Novosphingobium sp. KACC 22771]|uniref:Mrp/NBP35 family ATP-binding protein n=1 Tax=Novosphingobium sp. KACC 22771 TaxID=3025670 RepID=UPI0023663B04|nr:Mrp/NBP35 family ATP-binding protein [Novosphingobium sp. KACC 22771]WDF72098.1 Mrp/NBP35 family ATP-binding protein [Novosphingobium sp. KACC 22771]
MTAQPADDLRQLLPADVGARVQSLRLADGVVTLVLDGAGLDGAGRAAIEAGAKAALNAAPGVSEVRVGVVADRDAGSPAQAPAPKGPLILAVGSGKGGVGKSTLSANLAVALARSGIRVGLVDADIYGPSQPRLLANEGKKPEAKDSKMFPVPSRYGVSVLSMGHLIEDGRAIAWRGPMVSGALNQLIDAWWGETQVLVIDLPPGTGDVQLTMVQKHKPAGAVIVSTPQDLALMDASRALNLFEAAHVPVLGLVENMAGYVCPHCGNVSDPFGCGAVEDAADRLKMPFLGRVPLDMAIRLGSDAGEPPAAGDGPQAEAFALIARKLLPWLATQGVIPEQA